METAAIDIHVDILKELIEKGGNMNRIKEGWSSAFALACRRGSSKAAITLINTGLDLDLQTRSSLLPHFSAAAGYLTEIVEDLLQKGADMNLPNSQGQTALLYAPDYEFVGDQTSFTQRKCMEKKLTLARINVNVIDRRGETALGMACWRGFTSVIKLLLEASADISISSLENHAWYHDGDIERDSTRSFPSELAAEAGHEDIVQLLLVAKGANW